MHPARRDGSVASNESRMGKREGGKKGKPQPRHKKKTHGNLNVLNHRLVYFFLFYFSISQWCVGYGFTSLACPTDNCSCRLSFVSLNTHTRTNMVVSHFGSLLFLCVEERASETIRPLDYDLFWGWSRGRLLTHGRSKEPNGHETFSPHVTGKENRH